MKTLLSLLLIPLIIVGPFAFKASTHRNKVTPASEGTTSHKAASMIQSVDLYADLIIAVFITAAFILAFLIFRLTFGAPFVNRLSLLRYCLFALAPTLLFALTFVIQQPGDILAMFSAQFGQSASGIIFGVAFVYGIIAHFMACLVIAEPKHS